MVDLERVDSAMLNESTKMVGTGELNLEFED